LNRRFLSPFRICVFALGLTLLVGTSSLAQAQYRDIESAPVYQRHAFERSGHGRGKFDRRFDRRFHTPAPHVNSAWFQRPYPYHLDYYKMRYGGSYAPYFGNLYGPPQVVTAPPYYGPFYGGFEYANPGDGAYGVPNSGGPSGPILRAPTAPTAPSEESELPAP
jgi:hypothetical protein